MPSLFKFAEDHKSQSDRFVILTFHQGRGEASLDAIKPKIDELVKNRWKIGKFPFPILMDATGKTLKTWGVNGFPTAFLIDPEGKIVAQDHHGIENKLAEALANEGAKAKPDGEGAGKSDGKKAGGKKSGG